VGVGTTTPDYLMQIEASDPILSLYSSGSNRNTHIYMGDSTDADAGRFSYDVANDQLQIWTNGAKSMTVNSDATTTIINDNSGTGGANLHLFHDTESGATGDYAGDLVFYSNSDAGNKRVISRIRGYVEDATDTSEDAILFFFNRMAGVERESLRLTSTVNQFNAANRDVDFKVSSESQANTLFVDAGRDTVIFGKNISSYPSQNAVVIGGTLRTSYGASLGFENDATGGADGFILATDDTWGIGPGFGMGLGASSSDNFRMFFTTSEVVFNERSLDIDFRVESNLADYMFFVDAGADKIGINTNSPEQMLTINGGMLRVKGSMTDPNDSGGAHFWNQGGVGPTISGLSTMIRGGGSGSQVELAHFSTSENTFNEAGGQTDFRIESDSNSHMLFVDAGAGHVNIQNSSDLGATFNVAGNAFITGAGASISYPTYARFAVEGGGAATDRWGDGSKATVAIRSKEMTLNEWFPTLHITTIRQSLTTGFNATGGIGFTTIDDSNGQGIDDAARIEIYNTSGSSRNSPTGIQFYTNTGGTVDNAAQAVLKLDNTSTVFNEGSYNTDFRVESDSNAHMLFVDAGENTVIVGTNVAATGGEITFVADNLCEPGGGMIAGFVPGSLNNNTGFIQLFDLTAANDGNAGCVFSGKIWLNSFTGFSMADVSITKNYTTDVVAFTVTSTVDGNSDLSGVNLRVATVSSGGRSYLGIQKNGGGIGIAYIQGFINGGPSAVIVREIASGSYTLTTNHGNIIT
jgi:hypothetical protein